MLTRERLLELLDYDPVTGIFRWKTNPRGRTKPGDIAGTITKRGYIHICLDQHLYLGHRLAWFYVYGVWPVQLDHKDQRKGNNAIENLREATRSQNMINGRGVGVYWHKKARKFGARIKHNYKQIHIGLFVTRDEALVARKAKAIELFGEFAS